MRQLSPLEKRAKELSKTVTNLFPGKKPVIKKKPKNLDFLKAYGAHITPIKEVKQLPKPKGLSFDYKALKVKDGKDGKDGRTPTNGELEALMIPIINRLFGSVEIKQPEVTTDFVKEIIKVMKSLPEVDRLEIQDIRNAQQFLFNGKKYRIEELMHGGGGSTSSGFAVTSQYQLTAVQSGSDVTIDLSQLTYFSTYEEIITVFRNNIPQTQTLNFTIAGPTLLIYNADASEVFNVTYSYTP